MAVQMKKKATSIDMTAMCDVAFLLLTFFILTATAKVPEPLPVDTPASTVETKLPEDDLAIITIGKAQDKDKVFFEVKGRDVRKRTLELMGQKYNVSFTDDETNKFALIDGFGVPITALKQLIAMSATERNKEGLQPGIPKDSLDNQLAEWIRNARLANNELHPATDGIEKLKFAIKGDAKEEYPQIRKIMDILQDQKINSFGLITGTRAKEK